MGKKRTARESVDAVTTLEAEKTTAHEVVPASTTSSDMEDEATAEEYALEDFTSSTGLGENAEEQPSSLPTPKRKPPALPWMRKPLDLDTFESLPLEQVPGLDHRIAKVLHDSEFKTLFPVQLAVWRQIIGPGGGERDLCICSPTGSGKTLAYVLPIVQILSSRIIRRLRALVVLPTRDLAMQVKAVFDLIAPAVGLSVGLAIGQTQVSAEAAELVKLPRKCVHSFSKAEAKLLDTVESRIDVLVATPGRLMDHITNTEGFTLEHLHYLVVDETDRLLRQDYQQWLPNVLDAAQSTIQLKSTFMKSAATSLCSAAIGSVRTIRHSGLQRGLKGSRYPRVTKLVLSATLTRDPAKLSQLDLYYPMYISSSAEGNRYKIPKQLQAYKLVCEAGLKPLHLVALLQLLNEQRTIVFTASVISTHRLFLLLSCFEGLPFKIVEYSSLQHQHVRSEALAAFRAGAADVLVASDAMTRGMDVEGVMNVINYDVPVYAKTYVHRVGRTARAGRSGCSYTLLRKEEVRHFKELLQKADNSKCKSFTLPSESIEELYPCYLAALEKLKETTISEAAGSISDTSGTNQRHKFKDGDVRG